MATPVAGELADDLEQPLAFGRRQGRGRLVHDQDAGLERQRLGDLDQLLLADPQGADAGVGVEVDAQAGSAARGAARSRAAAVDDQPGDQRVSRPRKMLSATLSSGTRLSSWWMMAMPAASASRGAGEADRRAIERELAVVVGMDAGQDLHQRRLAGAVLAHQARGSRPAARLEVDIAQSDHAAERFDTPRASSTGAPSAANRRELASRMAVSASLRPVFRISPKANLNVSNELSCGSPALLRGREKSCQNWAKTLRSSKEQPRNV